MTKRNFPAQADVDFYRAMQKVPGWILTLTAEREKKQNVLGWERHALIDIVVNAHSGQRPTSGECAAHNLLAIVRSWRRRGEDIRVSLLEVSQAPGCMINPEKRAAFARKWARRMQRSRA